ncbi:hypothetical protein V3N99_02640 [Dermatophilaceae bacterium Soc4.6]
MPHLLFVCVANRARSPLAQLIAQERLGAHPQGHEITVASAGVWTAGDEPMWPPAAAAARALTLDPAPFRSRQITSAIVADSELVLAATRTIRDGVVAANPKARDRVLTWRELAWVFSQVAPDWQGLPLAQRPQRLPAFVSHYRSRITWPPGEQLDVQDPAGAPSRVMAEASALTLSAVDLVVAGLCA